MNEIINSVTNKQIIPPTSEYVNISHIIRFFFGSSSGKKSRNQLCIIFISLFSITHVPIWHPKYVEIVSRWKFDIKMVLKYKLINKLRSRVNRTCIYTSCWWLVGWLYVTGRTLLAYSTVNSDKKRHQNFKIFMFNYNLMRNSLVPQLPEGECTRKQMHNFTTQRIKELKWLETEKHELKYGGKLHM